ncbi:hypothetical protein MMC25_004239 [Agyrium rufum]|nr:hypothetical protein [Agyrium rufum]
MADSKATESPTGPMEESMVSPKMSKNEAPNAEKPIVAPPPTSSQNQPSAFMPPTAEWLSGTWHVTHSTLPMWKTKRNVDVTYKPLPAAADGKARMDDMVEYQTLTSNKVKTIHGIDTAAENHEGAWDWRGTGWLKVATSHWAILSFGDAKDGTRWAVTYFQKTLFTPAGIDIYSSKRSGLDVDTVKDIKDALQVVEDREVRYLSAVLFEVQHDEE